MASTTGSPVPSARTDCGNSKSMDGSRRSRPATMSWSRFASARKQSCTKALLHLCVPCRSSLARLQAVVPAGLGSDPKVGFVQASNLQPIACWPDRKSLRRRLFQAIQLPETNAKCSLEKCLAGTKSPHYRARPWNQPSRIHHFAFPRIRACVLSHFSLQGPRELYDMLIRAHAISDW